MKNVWLFTGTSKPPKRNKTLEDMTLKELNQEFDLTAKKMAKIAKMINKIDRKINKI